MGEVSFSPLALEDVQAIAAHIREQSPRAAQRQIAQFKAAATELRRFPRRFAAVAEAKTSETVRCRPVGPYMLYYKVDAADAVVILRVLHAARDRDALIDES